PGKGYQFIRKGYFTLDKASPQPSPKERESAPVKLVFNRTVTLKDGWVKK
ncbi:MAG: hypothetical protein JST32_07650, partial [Bacteroidetes bacterium]|nr:hypothetical protein [Bacteroidota bacterium]